MNAHAIITLPPANLSWLSAPFKIAPCARCGKPVDTRNAGTVQDSGGLWHSECEQAAWVESGCGEKPIPPLHRRLMKSEDYGLTPFDKVKFPPDAGGIFDMEIQSVHLVDTRPTKPVEAPAMNLTIPQAVAAARAGLLPGNSMNLRVDRKPLPRPPPPDLKGRYISPFR